MTTRKRKRRSTTVIGRYRFQQKVHPKSAKGALIASLAMVVLYLIFVLMAYLADSSLSPYWGSAGVLAMVVSAGSFLLAVKSRFEDNVLMLYPNLALAASLLACICWVGTYGAGLSI